MKENGKDVTIKTFYHKGLKEFFYNGNKSGIQPSQASKISMILDLLEAADIPSDVDFPGSNFHPLKGELTTFYSVKVNGNWRIIFKFENGCAYEVNLIDYH